MSESRLYRQSALFSLRVIDTAFGNVPEHIYFRVGNALEFAMQQFELPGHLFVTLIAAENMGPPDEGWSPAHYLSGLQHVGLACLKPEQWDETKHGDYEHDLLKSLFHELAHYQQDTAGLLHPDSGADDSGLERCAEQVAEEWLALFLKA